ncbi:MAG TPA: hypothetical protein VGN07_15930 [Steroidobacteraceae bacterium]|jgi:uncharacterized membrane protein HdeD (DUF308 family)
MATNSRSPVERFAAQLSRHWTWLVGLGIAELLGGALAIAMPLIGTLISTFAYGWLLVIAGVLYRLMHFACVGGAECCGMHCLHCCT